jgi:hypothetical protein
MLVNIFMGNHDAQGASTLEDQCLAFQGALRALGHDAFLSCSFVGPPLINLVFDNFAGDWKGFFQAQLKQSRIGMICTERFAGSVLNLPDWAAQRARNLVEIGRQCSFLWCLDPQAVAPLQAELPGVRVLYTPIGYVKDLENVETLEPARKIWDICFTGSITPYRQEVLAGLTAKGLSVIAGSFPPVVRRSVMARSRLQLTLKQTADNFMPSQMRIAYCLANGFPVISDFAGVPAETPVEEFCINVKREELAERCLDLLRNPVAMMEAKQRIARFKATCRMPEMIADIVQRSLA